MTFFSIQDTPMTTVLPSPNVAIDNNPSPIQTRSRTKKSKLKNKK